MAIAITEQQRDELVPILTGEVEHAFNEVKEISQFFPAEALRGSDTKIDRVAGRAKVETIDWTEDDKHSQVGTFGTITYKVEASIYIRHSEKNISVLISDIDVLKELGKEHGKELAIQRDVTIMTALLVGTRMDAMTTSGVAGVDADNELDKVIEAGLHEVMDATGDINDVAKVEAKLENLILAQKARRKYSKSESMIAVSYALFNVLRKSDKLISSDFSASNGDYAEGELYKFMGVKLVPVTTFQDLQAGQRYGAGTTNPIAPTGGEWNVTALDAEARAVMFVPRALRVLEVMPVMADMWYERAHKVNYIDSQAFYGVGVRRQDYLAGLYTFEAGDTGTVGAGNELTSNVSVVGLV